MHRINFITPKQAIKLGDVRSLQNLTDIAKADDVECDVCSKPIWKYGHGNETGLCFTCTTGESDPSDDYELIPE